MKTVTVARLLVTRASTTVCRCYGVVFCTLVSVGLFLVSDDRLRFIEKVENTERDLYWMNRSYIQQLNLTVT